MPLVSYMMLVLLEESLDVYCCYIYIVEDFVAIHAGFTGTLVDNTSKVSGFFTQCYHGMMPDARSIGDTLLACGYESGQGRKIRKVICK